MDPGGTCCYNSQEKREKWHSMKSTFENRTTSLHATEQELRQKISQMEMLLASHSSDSTCCCHNYDIPKVFSQSLESPVRDVPKVIREVSSPVPPSSSSQIKSPKHFTSPVRFSSPTQFTTCTHGTSAPVSKSYASRSNSPACFSATSYTLARARSSSPSKYEYGPAAFFQKVMENAKSILTLRCAALQPSNPLDEKPTKEVPEAVNSEPNEQHVCAASAAIESCNIISTPTTTTTTSTICGATEEESTKNDCTTDSYSQDVTTSSSCAANKSASDSSKATMTPVQRTDTSSHSFSCGTNNATSTATENKDYDVANKICQCPETTEDASQKIDLDNCWVCPFIGGKKGDAGKPKKKGCKDTCAAFRSIDKTSKGNVAPEGRGDVRNRDEDNQCAFVGSPMLKKTDPGDGCGCTKETIKDGKALKTVDDLASKEKEIKSHIEDIQTRGKTYDQQFNNYQNMVSGFCCPCSKSAFGVNDMEKVSQELKLENKALKDELTEMKLELKHCLEKVEGPMKQKLETEKCRCQQLERELNCASQNMVMNQDAHVRELNALKLQLCIACSNIHEMNAMNRRLKEEMKSLDCMCAKLEDDLMKQKISEAETIKRLSKRNPAITYQEGEFHTPEARSDQAFECDTNLHAIARKLSQTLKESEPCEECAKLPAELAGAAKCIKDLTDMVDSKKKEMMTDTADGGMKDCACQSPVQTEDDSCQCVEGRNIGAGESAADIQKDDEVATKTLWPPPPAFPQKGDSSHFEVIVSISEGKTPSTEDEAHAAESTYYSADGEPMAYTPEPSSEVAPPVPSVQVCPPVPSVQVCPPVPSVQVCPPVPSARVCPPVPCDETGPCVEINRPCVTAEPAAGAPKIPTIIITDETSQIEKPASEIQPPASEIQPPASEIQAPASEIQAPASEIQPPASPPEVCTPVPCDEIGPCAELNLPCVYAKPTAGEPEIPTIAVTDEHYVIEKPASEIPPPASVTGAPPSTQRVVPSGLPAGFVPCTESCGSQEPCAQGQPCYMFKGQEEVVGVMDLGPQKEEDIAKVSSEVGSTEAAGDLAQVSSVSPEEAREKRSSVIEPGAEEKESVYSSGDKVLDEGEIVGEKPSETIEGEEMASVTPSAVTEGAPEGEIAVKESAVEGEMGPDATVSREGPADVGGIEAEVSEAAVSAMAEAPSGLDAAQVPTEGMLGVPSVAQEIPSEIIGQESAAVGEFPVIIQGTIEVTPSEVTAEMQIMAGVPSAVSEQPVAITMPLDQAEVPSVAAPPPIMVEAPSYAAPGMDLGAAGEIPSSVPIYAPIAEIPSAVAAVESFAPAVAEISSAVPAVESFAPSAGPVVESFAPIPSDIPSEVSAVESMGPAAAEIQSVPAVESFAPPSAPYGAGMEVVASVQGGPGAVDMPVGMVQPPSSMAARPVSGAPFQEERTGYFPFDVDTKVAVLDSPPTDLHITTTITASGTLEVITEGTTGIIETTLTYKPDGAIEVVTHVTEGPRKMPATVGRPGEDVCPPCSASAVGGLPAAPGKMLDDAKASLLSGATDLSGLETVSESTKDTTQMSSFVSDFEKTAADELGEDDTAAGVGLEDHIIEQVEAVVSEVGDEEGGTAEDLSGEISVGGDGEGEEEAGMEGEGEAGEGYEDAIADLEEQGEEEGDGAAAEVAGEGEEEEAGEIEEGEGLAEEVEAGEDEEGEGLAEEVEAGEDEEGEGLAEEVEAGEDEEGEGLAEEVEAGEDEEGEGLAEEVEAGEDEEGEGLAEEVEAGEDEEEEEGVAGDLEEGVDEEGEVGEAEEGEEGIAADEEGEVGEAEVGEAEAGEAETGEAEAGEAEAGEAEAGEAEAGEAEAGEVEAGEAEVGEAVVGEVEEGEAEEGEAEEGEEITAAGEEGEEGAEADEVVSGEFEEMEGDATTEAIAAGLEESGEGDLTKDDAGLELGTEEGLAPIEEGLGEEGAATEELEGLIGEGDEGTQALDLEAEQALKRQKRDCACQSTPTEEQSCQCCECKDVGVSTSQDIETTTDDTMVQSPEENIAEECTAPCAEVPIEVTQGSQENVTEAECLETEEAPDEGEAICDEEAPATCEEAPEAGEEETPATGEEEASATGEEEVSATGEEEAPAVGEEETRAETAPVSEERAPAQGEATECKAAAYLLNQMNQCNQTVETEQVSETTQCKCDEPDDEDTEVPDVVKTLGEGAGESAGTEEVAEDEQAAIEIEEDNAKRVQSVDEEIQYESQGEMEKDMETEIEKDMEKEIEKDDRIERKLLQPSLGSSDSRRPRKQRSSRLQNVQCDCPGICQCVVCSPKIIAQRKALTGSLEPPSGQTGQLCCCITPGVTQPQPRANTEAQCNAPCQTSQATMQQQISQMRAHESVRATTEAQCNAPCQTSLSTTNQAQSRMATYASSRNTKEAECSAPCNPKPIPTTPALPRQHPPGCQCVTCICNPCTPCPPQYGANTETFLRSTNLTPEQAPKDRTRISIDDIFTPPTNLMAGAQRPAAYQRSGRKPHPVNCECIDCLCLPKIKAIAGIREHPIIRDEKQVYQVKCVCPNTSKKGSKIPIATNSLTGPPKAKSSASCSCGECKCNPCSDPNQGASKEGGRAGDSNAIKLTNSQLAALCDCKECDCKICFNKPAAGEPDKPEEKQGTTSKNCCCKDTCTCETCPIDALARAQAQGSGASGECDCKECVCPKSPTKSSAPGECDCKECVCPKSPTKLQKIDETIPEVTKKGGGEKPPGCDCGDCQCPGLGKVGQSGLPSDCDCSECACPGASKLPKPEGATIADCDCEECQCSPCADPKKRKPADTPGAPSGIAPCDCPDCKCEPCADPTKRKDKGDAVQPHGADCDCAECACADGKTPQTTNTGVGSTENKEAHATGCTCAECKCVDCIYKKNEKVIHAGGCKCSECVCKEGLCTGRVGDGPAGTVDTATHSPNCICDECMCSGDEKHEKGCTCPECKCLDCYYKRTDTGVHADGCQCTECICKDCEKKQAGDAGGEISCGEGGGCTCGDCKCIDCFHKRGKPPSADECRCGDCLCQDCSKRKPAEAAAGGKKEATAPPVRPVTPTNSCHCMTCYCDVCTNPNREKPPPIDVGGGAKPASGAPGHAAGCTCSVCQCVECESKKKEEKQQDKGCTCTTCICVDCAGKKAEDKGAHPDNCTCQICECKEPGVPSGPGASTAGTAFTDPPPFEVPVRQACACQKCECEVCNKDMGAAAGGAKSAAGAPGHAAGCTCSVCQCVECESKKKEEKGQDKDCTCTTCICVDCAGKKAEDKGAHPDNCTCPICECKEPGAPSGPGASTAGTAFTDPPPFEVPVRQACACQKCECEVCNKAMGAAAGGKKPLAATGAQPGESSSTPGEAPPFNVPVRSPCTCETCICGICNKEGKTVSSGKNEEGCDCQICECPDDNPPSGTATQSSAPPTTTAGTTTGVHCDCPTCSCAESSPSQNFPVAASKSDKVSASEPTAAEPPPFEVPAREPCLCQKCDCPICNKDMNAKGGTGPQKATAATATASHCDCATCTCSDSPTNFQPVESKSTQLNVKGKQRDEGGGGNDHPPGCDCPICCAHSGSESAVDITKLDNTALKERIEKGKRENGERRENIKDLRQTLDKIKNSCTEAETNAMANKPFVKQASCFGQTMSGLKFALTNLQEKCKEKDRMIEAMTNELKSRTSSNTFDQVLNIGTCIEPPDFDRAQDIKPFERSRPVTNVLFKVDEEKEIGHTKMRSSGKKKKNRTCKCGKPHKDRDNINVDLSGFEVVDIRRITQDSIIIKWKPPQSNIITGYDIFVNGVNKSKVMSGGRTSAMIHGLDLTATIQITIYAVTKCGRCEPPAIAIYEINC